MRVFFFFKEQINDITQEKVLGLSCSKREIRIKMFLINSRLLNDGNCTVLVEANLVLLDSLYNVGKEEKGNLFSHVVRLVRQNQTGFFFSFVINT